MKAGRVLGTEAVRQVCQIMQSNEEAVLAAKELSQLINIFVSGWFFFFFLNFKFELNGKLGS